MLFSEKRLKINWFLILLLFENVTSNIKDLAVVIKKNGNRYEASCLISGNSTELAVDWITPISKSYDVVESFSPNTNNEYNCLIGDHLCELYWHLDSKWELQNSLTSKFGPVLDYRWESFKTVYTNGQRSINVGIIPEDFEINFSVRGFEGHFFLCSRSTKPYCYWIILNGWKGQTTAIRKCEERYIPISRSDFPKSCLQLEQNNSETKNILDKSRWVHFTLQRTKRNILLYKIGDKNPILNYTDNQPLELPPLKPSYLSISSGGEAYWKFHVYDYKFTTLEGNTQEIKLYSNISCLSAFVYMCDGCKLIVGITNRMPYFENSTSSVYSSNENEWQRIEFNLTNVSERYSFLIFTTVCENCKNPFWAIHDFQSCAKEIRKISSNNFRGGEMACQIVSSSEQIIYNGSLATKPAEVLCPVGTFGTACQFDTSFLQTTCNNCIICTKGSTGKDNCRCSPGYTGLQCEKECKSGYYGHGCQQECGFCKHVPCNHITGTCFLEECLFGYKGINCNISVMPVLNYPPRVVAIEHKSITVQVLDPSYVGDPTPFYYKIQYKATIGSTWISLYPVSLNSTDPIQIKNLNTSTDYYIRAVLVLYDGNSSESESVPKIKITTTCAFVKSEDAILKTSNTSAFLMFKNQRNSSSCRSNTYKIWLDGLLIPISESYQFTMKNLTPLTLYSVTIKNSFVNDSLILNLYTGKSNHNLPTQISDLKGFANSTSITLSWNQPQTPDGAVTHYKVSYQHLYNIACNRLEAIPGKIYNVTSHDKKITLEKLIPYSEYRIEVVAMAETEGKSSAITIQTTQTDKPENNELPKINRTSVKSTEIDVLLTAPNCKNIKGSLMLHISYQCYNHWCPKRPSLVTYSVFNYEYPVRILNLLPYTDYNIEIQVTRSDVRENGPKLNKNVVTSASIPNKIENIVIYSKNETSVSARFPLPYPPTGILTSYEIGYCYGSSPNCKTITVPAKDCLLWPSLQCVTIYSLISNTSYNFSISGRNKFTKFGEYSNFTAGTWVEAPSSLLRISAEWDEYYNLTLKWTHPSISNGVLTSFIFQIFKSTVLCNQFEFPIVEKKYEYSYNFTVQVDKGCYSSNLNIQAWANTIYKGNMTSIRNIASPPVAPSFGRNPQIVNITNTSLTLELEDLIDFERKSLMHIIITATSDKIVRGEYNEQIWKKSGLSKTFPSWIAAEYNYHTFNLTSKIVILGNDLQSYSTYLNREIRNRILSPETKYIITILLTSTYSNMERHLVYRLYASTTVTHTVRSYTPLFGLLILLIIPFIIWFIVKKSKKPNYISWSDMLDNINARRQTTQQNDIIPLSTSRIKF
ncbi:hypothetical protein FQR65_LT04523 [Abscondita terminalis]|nr:hypothetical protein FQR65_LT04523 [Abscondita terminalis]